MKAHGRTEHDPDPSGPPGPETETGSQSRRRRGLGRWQQRIADEDLVKAARADIDAASTRRGEGPPTPPPARPDHSPARRALDELRRRHRAAVVAYARLLCPLGTDADELAAAAFDKAVDPEHAPLDQHVWRISLLEAVGQTAFDWVASGRGDALFESFRRFAEAAREPAGGPVRPPAGTAAPAVADTALVLSVFRRLRPRHQVTLWYATAESEPAEHIAVLLGTVASAVPALTSQARRQFREICLDEQLSASTDSDCLLYARLLSLAVRQAEQPQPLLSDFATHLAHCPRCTQTYRVLHDLEPTLQTLLPNAMTLWRGADYAAARRRAAAQDGSTARRTPRKAGRIRRALPIAVGVAAALTAAVVSTTDDDARTDARRVDHARQADARPVPPPTTSSSPPPTPTSASPSRPPRPETSPPAQRKPALPSPQPSACTGPSHAGLRPPLDESDLPSAVLGFTHDLRGGWTVDNSRMPAGGVGEWRGWAVATTEFWELAGPGQGREDFTRADGVIAVADPDEWDDIGEPTAYGAFDSTLVSPRCHVTGGAPLTIGYATHYRQHADQRGEVLVSFDDGPDQVVKSHRVDALNQQQLLTVAVPKGAHTATVKFRLRDARNDWYWALDRIHIDG
ncbi:hypothetical protein AB0M39_31730 [Streptomyces sp. NPDC051907]|uniref:hypothetical protein n=1 Tax=Streptomyces sp. NPDC051907 TaxID=3155284 RepID=UPI00343A74C6